MTQFLLVFDRHAGLLLSLEKFDSRADAMAGRFEAEREHCNQPDIEVVVLGADSEEALRATHSRYFSDSATMYAKALQNVLPRSA